MIRPASGRGSRIGPGVGFGVGSGIAVGVDVGMGAPVDTAIEVGEVEGDLPVAVNVCTQPAHRISNNNTAGSCLSFFMGAIPFLSHNRESS